MYTKCTNMYYMFLDAEAHTLPNTLNVPFFVSEFALSIHGKMLAVGAVGWPLWGEAGAAPGWTWTIPASSNRPTTDHSWAPWQDCGASGKTYLTKRGKCWTGRREIKKCEVTAGKQGQRKRRGAGTAEGLVQLLENPCWSRGKGWGGRSVRVNPLCTGHSTPTPPFLVLHLASLKGLSVTCNN